MSESEMVPEPVRKAVEKLAQPTPMRRGSLGQRFLRCGKPNCRCATHEDARHGPYFNLTRTVGGRTRSRRLSAQQAERARLQVAAGREFRQQVEAYWEACERWADAELAEAKVGSGDTVEKKGSKRSSRPRSRPKSRR